MFWIESLITLVMEAARTSETLVNFYQTTWCYNPEDSHLHNWCKYYKYNGAMQRSARKMRTPYAENKDYRNKQTKIAENKDNIR
jgi:hypothetical protein